MTEDYATADPRDLSAPDLVKWLRARAHFTDHWTAIATALGRVVDERIYERTEFGAAVSEEAWAKDRLGMTRGEIRLALKLWRMMNRHPEVPWSSLPKPRALLLDEVLSAGGNPSAWPMLAAQAKSTSAFERDVRRHLGEEGETFTTLKIRYPTSMTELVEEAFSRAATVALSDDLSAGQGNGAAPVAEGAQNAPQEPTAASWRDPAVGFRALEMILVEYLQPAKPITETP